MERGAANDPRQKSAVWSWPVREPPKENVSRILPLGAGGVNVRLWATPADRLPRPEVRFLALS
jgi:hypothetical protein